MTRGYWPPNEQEWYELRRELPPDGAAADRLFSSLPAKERTA